MRKTSLIPAFSLSLALLAGFSSCGGSSSSEGVNLGAACVDGGAMCVLSCTLGCTSGGGCTVSEIPVNQPLRFQFSRSIDPSTVNSESFSIRTPSGAQPSGSYVVTGNEVAFIPSVRTDGNRTLFGFAADAIYDLVLKGEASGSADLVRSIDGAALGKDFRCQIVANRGVIDIDGKRPEAKLLVPTSLTDVERNSLVILEFSEVLSTQIFQNGGAGAGILYTVSLVNEQYECETRVKNLPGTVSVNIDEQSNKTTVIFRPGILLPQNSCVQVQVTEQVRDLSGKGAIPISWEFKTKQTAIENQVKSENFNNLNFFDGSLSSADWGRLTPGMLVPGKLGGTGRLGDFEATDGVDRGTVAGRKVYEWNTDNQLIPGVRTISGEDIRVGDGVFEFATFEVKANQHVRWVGTHKPRIIVSGEVKIDGVMEIVQPLPSQNVNDPRPGATGICGGGTGGRGADLVTTPSGNRNGSQGGGVVVDSAHPRAGQAAACGGHGSVSNPETGTQVVWVKISNQDIFVRQTAAGGAGGSYYSPGANTFLGTKGLAKAEGINQYGPVVPAELGKDSTVGQPFPLFPLVPSLSSIDQFCLGGSGGGGGASDPFGSITPTVVWNLGAGGGAGGGCLIIQCGGDLDIGSSAELRVRGGDAVRWGVRSATPYPAPGGGGSGGSVLLQTAGLPSVRGRIDVSGGQGGYTTETSYGLGVATYGGNGGAGFIRVEADPAPNFSSFPSFVPAAATADNVGLLREIDYSDITSAVSLWYQTDTLFPPSFRYYVITAKITDGQGSRNIVYSDNPQISGERAVEGQPVVFSIQSAAVNSSGVPIADPTPWVTDDQAKGGISRLNTYENEVGNGFRWQIQLDRRKASQIEVDKVEVFFRG